MTVRLEAVEELLPSSIQVVPMRVQLVGLGIFSEVQQMYFTLEVHKLAIKVAPHSAWHEPADWLIVTVRHKGNQQLMYSLDACPFLTAALNAHRGIMFMRATLRNLALSIYLSVVLSAWL